MPPREACEACGHEIEPGTGLRCARCDALGCYGCFVHSEPVCPDCAEAERSVLPVHVEPMLATLSTLPEDERGWAFEYKWDGVRALAYWDGRRLRIESRNLLDITARYPEFAEIGKRLGRTPALLDGEIVALDPKGRPSFPLLQRRMHLAAERVERVAREVPAWYYLFDCLHAGDRRLLDRPYEERRDVLEGLGLDLARVRVPPRYAGDGRLVLETSRKSGLEGVVAKRTASPYQPGRRSPDWRKVKVVQSQEFVIGGWTPEKDDPGRVGSLALGVYEGGDLVYAGSVGTGFDAATHRRLLEKLRPLRRAASPFAPRPAPKKGLLPVAPRLVAEVEYRRWPAGQQVQQASFKGLRYDKPAAEVVRERVRR